VTPTIGEAHGRNGAVKGRTDGSSTLPRVHMVELRIEKESRNSFR
jgi:hypothetical protein